MKKTWWKEVVVYQIYPKSFQDTNNDGIGDIKGITKRLSYLKDLGIDVIWICPVYRSPMDDGGYDISDYYTIDEMFGNNEDFEELLCEAKKVQIKILMDLVVNHTSDEHDWFQKALANPKSQYRDYYIFREGIDGEPPNNWRSYFGGSAWEPVQGEENMYYLHAFSKKQPDLNWENEEVRQAIYQMINYWLEKGLGGFRIDAILNIKKRIESGRFETDGEDGLAFIGNWILNQPGIETFLTEMNEQTFKRHNSMTVAEADVPTNRLKEYIGDDGFFSMVFDFSYTDIDVPSTGEWFKETNWDWNQFRHHLFSSQEVTQENGWGAIYLENHDQPRSINKYIPEADINDMSKKMLATLLMCLRGTPFIYQGQELGMTNIKIDDINTYDDIATFDQYNRAKLSGMSDKKALDYMNKRSRDNSRLPMQWDTTKNAGFSDVNQTWLPVNPNYLEINAEKELQDEDSVLCYYKKLISLRKESRFSECLTYGEFRGLNLSNDAILAYERVLENQGLLVLCNTSNKSQTVRISDEYEEVIISNDQTIELANGVCHLKPYQSIILSNFGGCNNED